MPKYFISDVFWQILALTKWTYLATKYNLSQFQAWYMLWSSTPMSYKHTLSSPF